MTSQEKVARLLGGINHLEKTAGKLAAELTRVLAALKEVKTTLSTARGPFGVIYPDASEK